ncbi:MAG: 6-phosphofructokinase [Thermoanaerobacterales bacterium 50_218]|nr:MAG: 6-phosphofructokinase [Thermoanaerobacterales bacterium 50_218]HAA89629.1 6-phosphofructokinase [Peptococcaceae bacterium]
MKIGILTGGGDCPGINAVIRAITKTLLREGIEVLGFRDGYRGIIEKEWIVLDKQAISGLLPRGGTILGTNNRDNPFHYPVMAADGKIKYQDMSKQLLENLKELQLDNLIAIGGDGTLSIARKLVARGAKIIGVPKTIDNDLAGTDQTFGFDTAVATATEAIDKLHTTAESHHRVMVLEVMGRYAGWIALWSGIAGGADVILIPEIPWKLEKIVEKIKSRQTEGKMFSIIVVAEGTPGPDGRQVIRKRIRGSGEPFRLGGIGQIIGELIERETGMETRVTVLGHIQRGGSPSPFDRVLATRFGVAAAELALRGQSGLMVALKGREITAVPLTEETTRTSRVPPEGQLIQTARAIGISFGD